MRSVWVGVLLLATASLLLPGCRQQLGCYATQRVCGRAGAAEAAERVARNRQIEAFRTRYPSVATQAAAARDTLRADLNALAAAAGPLAAFAPTEKLREDSTLLPQRELRFGREGDGRPCHEPIGSSAEALLCAPGADTLFRARPGR